MYGVTKEGRDLLHEHTTKEWAMEIPLPRMRERKVIEEEKKEKKVKSQKKGGATLFISNRANKKSAYEKCRNESPPDCFQMKGLDRKGMKGNPNGAKIRMGIEQETKSHYSWRMHGRKLIMRTLTSPQSGTTLKAYLAVRKRHCF